jgi:intraflagellar transport protein 56
MAKTVLDSFQACCNYKLCDGKMVEADLKSLQDVLNSAPIENDLLNHNIVVFRNGEGALQVLYGNQYNLYLYVLKPIFRIY